MLLSSSSWALAHESRLEEEEAGGKWGESRGSEAGTETELWVNGNTDRGDLEGSIAML